jgi:small subunit ribosomal protein S15
MARVMLAKGRKKEIVDRFGLKEDDTGSPEVQVALLSERVKQLTEHLKANAHDYHSRRALLKLTGRRRRLLRYLSREDPKRYASVTDELGLKR